MTMPDRATRRVAETTGSRTLERDDSLIAEVPCELRFNGDAFAVMMLTPTDLHEFAIGFSLSERVIAQPSDIDEIRIHELVEGIAIDITATVHEKITARQMPGRTGCGLCGAARLEDALDVWPSVPDAPPIGSAALQNALQSLNGLQPLNEATGAAHAAAWATSEGDIVLVREDVGRHNAVDKLMRALVSSGTFDPAAGFVLVTSRASYEIVNKCLRFGVRHVAAMSAPTALAVDVARSGNMQLIAYLRDGRYVTY